MQAVAGTTAYVVNDRQLYAIDVESQRYVGDPIDLPPTTGTGNIAVSPGGRFVYVVLRTGLQGQPGDYESSALAMVDVVTREVAGNVALPRNVGNPVVSPDGGTVYVVGSASVTVVSVRDEGVVASVPVAASTGGIAVTPDGRQVVVTTQTGLVVVDARTNTVARTVALLGMPKDVVISPDGATAYVPAMFTGGADAGAILVVSLADGSIRGSVQVGSYPWFAALNPSGTRLYVVDSLLRGIEVIDIPLAQNITLIPLGVLPVGLAVTPGGDKLFVAKEGGPSVSVVATDTNTVVDEIVGPARTATASRTHFLGPMGSATPYVVEYFHGGFGHYFLTNNTVEMEKLDATPAMGWTRTGQRFGVYIAQPVGATSVCRFFTTAFGLRSSHFYAPRGLGCEATFANHDWLYEGDVYATRLPDADGVCPTGTIPVYRMYNAGQGGAPNHRYSADPVVRSQMLAQGWIAEGAGPGVGMCAPTP